MPADDVQHNIVINAQSPMQLILRNESAVACNREASQRSGNGSGNTSILLVFLARVNIARCIQYQNTVR